MQFFLPKTDPDVCKYQPDIIRSEGPDFTFHNFDVFTSAKPDFNNKERENKEIHIYPASHNLDQIQDFFYCGGDIGGSSRLQFFWRRPWIEISSADHFSCNFNANVSIPYSIKAVTKCII